MGRKRRKGRGAIPRAAILAALWTLIAVTLLSALAPLGPPLSRATGSAFNPATSDVVLKARAPSAAQAVPPIRPDGDGWPPVAILGLAIMAIVGVWRFLPALSAPPAAPRLPRPPLVRAHLARAPPASF
ncbi:hypothetical protein K3M67_10570 [Sphingobium sp. V4]|uniref:hypothetical protein n=1 Tax=Sphingobium sp. V4 TaxID=3038927 RepID=UPI002557D045|nr:hypothetical protein [Sphingobium sp. V4]WIW87423.1 hypothetical protein K3M67_10570 [Sphingobium sp. V4]